MHKMGRVAILGGDARMMFAAAYLLENGIPLRAWGMGESAERIFGDSSVEAWQEAIEGADALVLPLPASRDGVRVFAPGVGDRLSPRLMSLLEAFGGRLVLGGRLEASFIHAAEARRLRVCDYFEDESLCLRNAQLTAEGAISLAMEALSVSLFGTEVAVAGYGRIGSFLADALSALGAHVTVLARRKEVLTQAELCGHKTTFLEMRDGRVSLEGIPNHCRVLFNTVPSRIFSPDDLASRFRDCLFLDLASAPGGIDHASAEKMGIRTVWGTALPGKYAPESAGRAVGRTLLSLLEQSEKGE